MAQWTAATRRQYLKESPDNFAGPHGSFPIKDGADVESAWNLAGHATDPDATRAKITTIAARMGLTGSLPKTATATKADMSGVAFDEFPGDTDETPLEQMSFDEIQSALYKVLNPEGWSYLPGARCYHITRTYTDAVIFCDDHNGRVYRSTYTIDAAGNAHLGVPVAVKEQIEYVPVSMAATLMVAPDGGASFTMTKGDAWVRTGKIFEAGEYPDKNFVMDAGEMAAAITRFTPVECDLEHESTILDGKLGKVTAIYTKGDDPFSLYGDVELPLWMRGVLGDAPLKVSCTWDRQSKQLQKLALVKEPRVADAALLSAFSAHTPPADPSRTTDAGSGGSMRGAAIHTKERDMADKIPLTKATFRRVVAYLNGEAPEQAPTQVIRHIHEGRYAGFAADGGATDGDGVGQGSPVGTPSGGTGSAYQKPAKGNRKKGKKLNPATSAHQAYYSAEDEDEDAAETADESAELTAARARIATQEAEIATFKASQLTADAAAFADAEIVAKRAFPAERDTIIYAYTRAAADDSALPTAVTFSQGEGETTGTRVEALKAQYSARPAHGLDVELVSDESDGEKAAAQFNAMKVVAVKQTTQTDGEGGILTAERRAALMSHGTLGPEVLKREKSAHV